MRGWLVAPSWHSGLPGRWCKSSGAAPKSRIGRMNCAAVVAQTRAAIDGEVQWSVEIDDLGLLRDKQRRRDPKRRADRATDHDPEAAPLGFRRQREHFGQPAG